MFRRIIGKAPDFEQRCALCNNKEPAPYQLHQEYIKELGGNSQRDCVHMKCLENRQVRLRRFPFQRVALDFNVNYCTGPYTSDNEIVLEDTPQGRHWAKDDGGTGLAFFWRGDQFFIEPKRSEWLQEHTTYPRNFLVSLDIDKWWLILPRNQALLFKLTWGGEVQDA